MRCVSTRTILALLVSILVVLSAQGALAAALPEGFNVESFRENFSAGLAGRPNMPVLKAENVRVVAAEKAATFGNTDIFAVKGSLAPEAGQSQPFIMFVSADGKYYVSDIVDMRAGKSILKDSRERLRKTDLKDMGHTVFRGTGKHAVTFVSDPFCPYCRTAFAYMLSKSARYSDFRLAHFPLTSHPGADIACALMVWAAQQAPKRQADFVRFAYTDLVLPKIADKSPEQMEKAWVQVADAFLARFPELKALGKNGKAIVAALNGSPYVKAVSEDMAKAAGMDISGTPIIFVDDARVEGFDGPRLESLLK